MLEDESDEVRAIVAFVKEKEERARAKIGTPAQYKEIRRHFAWSQDKWSKNWKNAKLYLEKKSLPKGGYPKYFVKKDFTKEAGNMLSIQRIVSQISKERVQEIEISSLRLQEAIGKHVEGLRPMFKNMAWNKAKEQFEPLFDKLKTISELQQQKQKGKSRISRLFKGTNQNQKELPFEYHPLVLWANQAEYEKTSAELFEVQLERSLLMLASHTKINVVYNKDEPLPIVEDSDIVHLLDIFARNVKAKIKKPWHIVATFHVPEEDYIQDQDNEAKN